MSIATGYNALGSFRFIVRWAGRAGVVGCAILGPTRPAQAQIAVFDASSYSRLVAEISQGATEISTLESQLRTAEAMDQSLPAAALGSLSPIVGETAGLIVQLQGLSTNSATLVSSLNNSFPLSFTTMTPQQLTNQLAANQAQTRQAITTAQQIQAQIAANQSAISTHVTSIEGSSASAVGTTQAVQATNQLLGNIASQLTEQNALTASAANAVQQSALADQSGEAAAKAMWNQSTAPLNTGKQF